MINFRVIEHYRLMRCPHSIPARGFNCDIIVFGRHELSTVRNHPQINVKWNEIVHFAEYVESSHTIAESRIETHPIVWCSSYKCCVRWSSSVCYMWCIFWTVFYCICLLRNAYAVFVVWLTHELWPSNDRWSVFLAMNVRSLAYPYTLSVVFRYMCETNAIIGSSLAFRRRSLEQNAVHWQDKTNIRKPPLKINTVGGKSFVYNGRFKSINQWINRISCTETINMNIRLKLKGDNNILILR